MRRTLEEVFAPVKGIDDRLPSTMADTRFSTGIKNMRLSNGEARKDWGYTTYGTNQPLSGVPCSIDIYKEYDGDIRPLSLNTTHLYEYNSGNDVWYIVNAGTELDDCETAWDGTSTTATYYFDGNSASDWTNPSNMDDGGTGTYGNSSSSGDRHAYNSNTATATDIGKITKVEIRMYGYWADGGALTNCVDCTMSSGSNFKIDFNTTPQWRPYEDITSDKALWTWTDINDLTMTVDQDYNGTEVRVYATQIRVTYDAGVGTDVTVTADETVRIRGSKSMKAVIGSSFGTGIVCSSDDYGTPIDISAATHTNISFWVRSSVALAADVLQVRVSEETDGGTGGTYTEYNIPALTADTWTYVNTAIAGDDNDGGSYPTDLDAVLTTSLVALSDPGACTIYLDDIRAIYNYTGDQDDGWSGCMHNNDFYSTNYDDDIQRKQQDGLFAAAGWSGAYHAKDIHSVHGHLVLLNTEEGGSGYPHRARWTISGTLSHAASDFTTGTAGSLDLLDTSGHIIKGLMLGDELAIYKEDSIFSMSWIGGDAVFRQDLIVENLGLLSIRALKAYKGAHYFVGSDYNIYKHIGTREPVSIGDAVVHRIASLINPEYDKRVTLIVDEDYNEILVGIPTGDSTQPDIYYRYNLLEKNWSSSERDFICSGVSQTYSTLTIGTLGGTLGSHSDMKLGDASSKSSAKIILTADSSGYIYQIDRTVLNLNGSVQEAWIDTIDFTMINKSDGKDNIVLYQDNFKRVMRTIVEARGNDMEIWYSTDSGRTWRAAPDTYSHTLTSYYKLYQDDFNHACRKIRLRFKNSTVSSDMIIRYFAIEWLAGGKVYA